MPWTAADARRHKKGLSARQARQWAAVANAALAACLRRGRSQRTCDGSAVRQANGAVGPPARRPTSNQTLLTTATALTVQPHRHSAHGQDYLVAPCVLLVAGVLNRGLVVNEAIVPDDWNGVPVVVNHPVGPDQQPVSARSPAVLETCGIGAVYHARLGQGLRSGFAVHSLVGELWVNLALAQRCGAEAQQVVAMLEAQQPLEVSTAFYPDAEPHVGLFHGTPYTEVYTRLRPDHLAVLPNGVGACSWTNGGCGSPRLHHTACDCVGPCHCEEGVTAMDDATGSPSGTGTPARSRWQRFMDFFTEFAPWDEAPDDESAPEGEGEETAEAAPALTAQAYRQQEVDAAQTRLTTGLPLSTHERFLCAEPAAYVASRGPMLVIGQTDTDVREALYGCLAREMGRDVTPVYIDAIDLATQTFTYRMGERLCQRAWSVEDGLISLAEGQTDVQRHTSYTPVPDSPQGPQTPSQPDTYASEEPPMAGTAVAPTIQARVDALIANPRRTYTELDRSRLLALDEAMLMVLEQQPLAPEPPPPPPPAREGYLSLDEALQSVAPEDRDLINVGLTRERRRKTQMVEQLVGLKDNPFPEPELQAMEVDRLEKLVVMAGLVLPGQAAPGPVANFAGRRMPHLRIVHTEDGQDDNRPPPLPNTMELVVEEQKRRGVRF